MMPDSSGLCTLPPKSAATPIAPGDRIEIDIPNRSIHLAVDDAEIAKRREEQDEKGWKPAEPRKRKVTAALKAYAALTTSAAKGAVRKVD